MNFSLGNGCCLPTAVRQRDVERGAGSRRNAAKLQAHGASDELPETCSRAYVVGRVGDVSGATRQPC